MEMADQIIQFDVAYLAKKYCLYIYISRNYWVV